LKGLLFISIKKGKENISDMKIIKKENAILEAIREGRDDAALSFLYSEVYPKVRNMIIKNNGQIDDAKDVFQDAVIVFYKYVKQGKFDDEKDIGGFIYGVSRNLFYKLINKTKTMQSLDSIQEIAIIENFENDLLTEQKETALHKLMEELGERCKELITLSVFYKFSMKEICEKMGFANENAAKTGNYKCKQRLTKMVEKNPALLQLFKG